MVVEPPEHVEHPDALLRELTDHEHARLLGEATAAARAAQPCESCGSTAQPVALKPAFGSVEWWLDPAAYLACADCGHFLAPLPVWLH
jgi:hypothetical protein